MSNSTHFAARLYSNWVKPVTLPSGRAKLSTKPEPTGSMTRTNTIGMLRVACIIGAKTMLLDVRMTSGATAIISAACLRMFVGNGCAPTIIDPYIAAVGPTQRLERLLERRAAGQ